MFSMLYYFYLESLALSDLWLRDAALLLAWHALSLQLASVQTQGLLGLVCSLMFPVLTVGLQIPCIHS